MISKPGEVDKKIKYLPLAFCPCLLVRWSSSSLVFQRHLLTTLISDLGLSTVHEKVSTGHLPRHVLGASFQGLSTDHLPGFVQATYQGLSTGRLPRHVYRPPSQACLQSTGHLPRLVHRPPWATIAQRLRTKDCHRSPRKACPRQVTFQGLSATVHLRRLVCCMLPSKACSPQVTFHGLSTGQHPVNITAWRLSILMYSSY